MGDKKSKFNLFDFFSKKSRSSDVDLDSKPKRWLSAKNKIYFCIAGVLFLIIVAIVLSPISPQKSKSKKNSKTENLASTNFVTWTENRLSAILNSVKGISNVEVFVTVNSSPKFIYAQDATKTENNGSISESSSIVIVKDGTTTSPVVAVEYYPQIEGILVVAKGAGNLKTQLMLADTISAVMGVPSSCIQILEGK